MKIVFVTGAEISEVECNWPVIPRIGESVCILSSKYKVNDVCYYDNNIMENTDTDITDLSKIIVKLSPDND